MIARIWAIIGKDLLIEIRAKEIFTSIFIFALLVILIFNFAFLPGSQNLAEVAPGILWVTFIFSGTLGLNRSFLKEKDKDCLEGLLLTPVDRSTIYLGKMLANLIFMSLSEVIILPIFAVFFNLNIFHLLFPLGVVIFLGTLGFVIVGTLFAAISVNTKTQEVMLPLLLLPIVVPVIIGAVKSTGNILAGKPWGEILGWIKLLSAFDLIFLVVSLLVFEFVVEQ